MTTSTEYLDAAGTPESTAFQDCPAWPGATPPLHGRGWPQVSPPPANVHEWESSQPVIPPDQCTREPIVPVSSAQRKYINQQLRSNCHHADER